jgi:hypothetical protein
LTSWSDILIGIRASLTKHYWLCEGFCAPVYASLYRRQVSCFEDSLNTQHNRVRGPTGLDAARSGIRMPNIMIDEFLLMIIISGIGLTVAYLRAEYFVHRRFKAAEHEKLIAHRELHANRLVRSASADPFKSHISLYNPIGKILVAIATPQHDAYALRVYDVAAYQRLVYLAFQLKSQHIAAADGASFLSAHPEWSTHRSPAKPFAGMRNLKSSP